VRVLYGGFEADKVSDREVLVFLVKSESS